MIHWGWLMVAALLSFAAGYAYAVKYGRIAKRVSARQACETRVRITKGEKQVETRALVDTGNRLREAHSGQPVLLVDSLTAANITDGNIDVNNLPDGFRTVGYRSLAGSGTLACFRPDALHVQIDGAWKPAREIWVGIYPGIMPGRVSALAPIELLG